MSKAAQEPHVLLVEDEQSLGLLLKENLKLSGFSVNHCKDGDEGWKTFDKEHFDLCILDVNMPKRNGFELAKMIREKSAQVPIVFLTANTSEEDKLQGYNLGGDEYVTKPFSTQELVARMKAILKRTSGQKDEPLSKNEIYNLGKTTFDLSNHLLTVAGETKKISSTEAELLKILILHKGQLLTRNAILVKVWGRDDFYTARNLDVYINKIRKLIKADTSIEIVNIHGSGFKLVENS